MITVQPKTDYRDDMALDASEMELDRQLRKMYRREQHRLTTERYRESAACDCSERPVQLVRRTT